MAKETKPKNKKNEIITKEKNVKVSKEADINMEELIYKKIQDALAQQEEKLKKEFEVKLNETKKENIIETKTSSLQIDDNIKFIPDQTMIRIKNNVAGKFIIKDNRGNGFFHELNGYGDVTTVPYKDLKIFNNQNRTFLKNGDIIITDVISDGDINIDNVLYDFNLYEIYYNENIIRPYEIEKYLSDKISIEEFSKKIEKSLSWLNTILKVSVILFKKGKFSDNNKMNKIRELTGKQKLFTN